MKFYFGHYISCRDPKTKDPAMKVQSLQLTYNVICEAATELTGKPRKPSRELIHTSFPYQLVVFVAVSLKLHSLIYQIDTYNIIIIIIMKT